MTREDIVRMARQAGFKTSIGKTDKDGVYHPDVNAIGKDVPVEWLERFAAIIAAAAIKDAPDYKMGYADGVVVEREAWAKVLTQGGEVPSASLSAVAAAIRARGNA